MEFTGERFLPNVDDQEIKIEHMQRYSAITQLVNGKTVLDAACGEGYGTSLLADYAKNICGIDIDEETIAHAKKKYVKSNIDYFVGSVEKLPFDDKSFDVVVSFETIEHVNEEIQCSFLKEVKRVLKQDGLFIISTPNKAVYTDARNYTNPFHVKEFYKQEFSDFLKGGFKYVEFFYQYRESTFILANEKTKEITNLELNKNVAEESKYIVAVCRDTEIEMANIQSAIVEENVFQKKTERILALQSEVQERNEHLNRLDLEIEEKNKHLSMLMAELDEVRADQITKNDIISQKAEQISRKQVEFDALKEEYSQVQNELNKVTEEVNQLQLENERLKHDTTKLHDENARLKHGTTKLHDENERLKHDTTKLHDENERLKHDTTKLHDENQQLKQKTSNLEAENSVLRQKENQLNNIFESDGWKLLLKYYRLRDKIISPNGKLRFFSKMMKRVVVDRNYNLINKNNIKKFIYHYKNQNLAMLENRVDNYIERNTNTSVPLELELEEIKTDYEKLTFPCFDKPKVSIVIPVYNQWHYTYACLKSILVHTKNVSYEVIIADDMSSDETVNAERYVENVEIVRDGINRGFVLNCNNAAEHAQGEYIYFLNNDTQVQEAWLEALVELIENDETIGMVGSKLVYPDGRMQEAGGIIWDDASGWNYGRLDDPNKSEYSYVKEVDYISGAAIMIRSSLWNEIGGFDKRYAPAYYEDTDLAFEVRKHGLKVMLNPKSVVVHFEGISHGKDENSKAQEYQKKNRALFLEKWQKELSEFHFKNSENVFVARDRSRNKKTIVVVDHYVPHFDRDAGSRCTYSYLKLFVKLGYKVVFIGDNFYKHEPYTSDLQARGIEVLYGNEYAQNIEKWFKDNKDFIDYVYLNRPHISIKYIDMVKKHTNAKILYFGHDLHYLRELRNYEIEKNPELLKSSAKWKETEFELFNKTDVVHVVGSYEQEVLMKELGDKPVRNIPLFMFSEDEYRSLTLNFKERKNLLFVGGFNHKPNYDGVLWFINEVFPSIKEKNPEIKFYIVGSNPPEDIQRLQSEDIIVTGYVTDEQLEQYYGQSRIVVVPLRYGAGVKGKVVEAIHHQVPIVTTPIGAEGLRDVEDTVLIGESNKEFAALTNDLYNDEQKWNKLAINSEQYIKAHFSIEAAINQIKQDIH